MEITYRTENGEHAEKRLIRIKTDRPARSAAGKSCLPGIFGEAFWKALLVAGASALAGLVLKVIADGVPMLLPYLTK